MIGILARAFTFNKGHAAEACFCECVIHLFRLTMAYLGFYQFHDG